MSAIHDYVCECGQVLGTIDERDGEQHNRRRKRFMRFSRVHDFEIHMIDLVRRMPSGGSG